MGREADCRATLGGRSAQGRALLETDELIFRGAFRARVPLREIASVSANDGVLRVRWPGGTLALEMGTSAERWAEAIRHPKSVLEKLGVAPGLRVAVLGLRDPRFRADVTRVLGAPPASRARRGLDLVILAVDSAAGHARIARLVESIRPAGGIWAVYPRGRAEASEDSIRAAARRAGLVDVKIARFSDTHGAVKLVIPKAAR